MANNTINNSDNGGTTLEINSIEIKVDHPQGHSNKGLVMQSYPARALDRRLHVDWARDPREGPRVLNSLRVDFETMG